MQWNKRYFIKRIGKTIYIYIILQNKVYNYNIFKFQFPPGFGSDFARKETEPNSADEHQQ